MTLWLCQCSWSEMVFLVALSISFHGLPGIIAESRRFMAVHVQHVWWKELVDVVYARDAARRYLW